MDIQKRSKELRTQHGTNSWNLKPEIGKSDLIKRLRNSSPLTDPREWRKSRVAALGHERKQSPRKS
jgi:hypothetical protein